MRRTKLRSEATQDLYQNAEVVPDFIAVEPSLREFEYWRIIANRFPYDEIATSHHMLVPKRKFAEYAEMLPEERAELDSLIAGGLEDYDTLMLNTRRGRTVLNWLHFHLLIFAVLEK